MNNRIDRIKELALSNFVQALHIHQILALMQCADSREIGEMNQIAKRLYESNLRHVEMLKRMMQ